MINDLKTTVELGQKLIDSINKKYKILILDIDEVYKSMLLLNKKKYACLKFIPPYDNRDNTKCICEIKGLDLIRRDLCSLSKKIGSQILDFILSGENKEYIINNILEYLKKVAKNIDENNFNLKEYCITKQLSKNIDDYKNINDLPHVSVAKRIKEKKIDENVKINSYISYIVCVSKDNSKKIAEKCFHPKEIENDSSLKVDFNWYKENQILNVVKKLVQNFQEINIKLDEILGIKNYNNNNKFNIGLKVKNGIEIECSKCRKINKINYIQNRYDCIQKIIQCQFCNNENNYVKLRNIFLNFIKKNIFEYYKRKSMCSKCKENINSLFCRIRCIDESCRGIMNRNVNEEDVRNEIKFFKILLCGENNNNDNDNNENVIEFDEEMKKIKNVVENVEDKILYNKIDLGMANFLKDDYNK